MNIRVEKLTVGLLGNLCRLRPRLRGVPLSACPLEPLVSGLRTRFAREALHCGVDMRLDVRTINGIVMTDAKDFLLNELISVTSPTDD
jgi:hypothetical protein